MRSKQLVLPFEKRQRVLELRHDSVWAGHLGERKTKSRIKASFYWPGMADDIKKHCQSCTTCQLRAPVTADDRVPITPLARPEVPFQTVYMDCIGPLDPPSARGHRYALCVVDACTRWPEVVCLKSLTARAVCDALVEIFSRMGVPETVCSDQGRNFTAQLTRLFLEKMGATPRFSTPDHPQSNGLVERWNGTFKKMLHHVVHGNGREWDKYVPFLLWAYREVPNETTGAAPFELMYGREPVRPLSMLSKTWTGEWTAPCGLTSSAEDYLVVLRQRFAGSAEAAREHSGKAQASYARYCNKNAKPKSFAIGDAVLVLEPDSTNALVKRWKGPLHVVEQRRPGSYLIRFDDESQRVVHANKLRAYHERLCTVGVIFEEDEDLGNIPDVPLERWVMPNSLDVLGACDHLDQRQRRQLQDLLHSFAGVFSSEIGRCRIGAHTIELIPGGKLKQSYPYKIPMAYRGEVERQIDELLEAKLIYPVESSFSHPVVCVGKKDGSMRLCIDYRQLNALTLPDAFPMTDASETLLQVARASFITTLDMLRGYWQIPMDPASEKYTAFVTHGGQYAWRVMPYGLKNSGPTFQRAMNEVLSPHRQYSRAYIDDVAVFSHSWEDHLKHLTAVLRTLTEVGLTANLNKCKFAQSEVRYLGHVVGSGLHAPYPNRIEAISKLERPTTKKELRSVLGLCNYYRDYTCRISPTSCFL